MAKGFGPKKAPQTTKRQTAYFKLIQALLKCPRGKELKILRAPGFGRCWFGRNDGNGRYNSGRTEGVLYC